MSEPTNEFETDQRLPSINLCIGIPHYQSKRSEVGVREGKGRKKHWRGSGCCGKGIKNPLAIKSTNSRSSIIQSIKNFIIMDYI